MPPWAEHLLSIGLTVLGSILVAWITSRAAGRAAAQKEQGDLAARLKELEETDSPTVLKALAEAKEAKDLAEESARDLARHIADEQQRRRDARDMGRQRDAELTKKVDDIKDRVAEQGGSIRALEARLDTSGGSRRGR